MSHPCNYFFLRELLTQPLIFLFAVIFGLLASDSGFVERDELIRFLREFEPQFDYRDLAVLFEEVSHVRNEMEIDLLL